MRLRHYNIVIILASIITLFTHINIANGCACCSSYNSWHRDHRVMDDYEEEHLEKFSFSGIFVEDHGEADYEFLNSESNITGAFFSPNKIKFEIKMAGADKASQIIFAYKKKQDFFDTDMEFWRKTSPMIQLYKEILFDGKATVSGPLGKIIGTRTKKAAFIIRGVGNACFNPEDYKHWILKFNIDSKQRKNSFVPFLGSGPATYPKSREGVNQ